MIKRLRALLWFTIILCLAITWLPYFNVFNSARFIAYMPQPLAVIIICNVILTLANIAIYWLYFKPFQKSVNNSDDFDKELGHE